MKYRDHCLNQHNRDPQFACSECSRVYNKYESLKSHKRTHNEHKKKFVCDICNKIYRGNSELQRHMKTHSTETPFPCIECNKS